MEVYRIAKGWRWFIFLISPVIIGLCSWFLLAPIIPDADHLSGNAYLITAPVLVGAIILFLIALSDTVKLRFVIDRDQVYSVSTFSKRQLMFDEIKGYRATDKYLIIESRTEEKKKIEISNYTEKRNDIIQWLDNRYPDLDLRESEEEKQEILESDTFGNSAEQRQINFSKAKMTSMLINCTGVLVALWAWFRPEPYKYVMLACLILPLISIAILKFYKGLIRIDQKKNSPYPTIFWSFFASSSALSVRSLLDFNIFDHSNIWIPSVATMLLLLTIIMLGSKEFSFKKTEDYFTIFNLILFLFAYGYGATITLNCIYDQSTSKSFDSSILHKRISTGKTTSYYLELSPWNNQVESAEETVSKEFYDSIDQSQTVKIEFHEGLLKIPWFVITK